MEEVVGYLFNLDVNKQQVAAEPQLKVGLVRDADGAPVDVAGKVRPAAEVAAAEDEAEAETDTQPEPTTSAPLAKGLERKEDRNLSYSAPNESGEATRTTTGQAKAGPKTGRNQPCPCGSGKKYKVCHGRAGA